MFRIDTLGFVFKVAAVAVLAVFGYYVVNCVQHLQIAELYKVAGTF